MLVSRHAELSELRRRLLIKKDIDDEQRAAHRRTAIVRSPRFGVLS
jgi:hypothetical protein